ncbi:hypothetical protein ACYCO6_33210 [Methylobacterium sp. CM6257]|jgi:hypothetical protein
MARQLGGDAPLMAGITATQTVLPRDRRPPATIPLMLIGLAPIIRFWRASEDPNGHRLWSRAVMVVAPGSAFPHPAFAGGTERRTWPTRQILLATAD